MSGDGQKCVIFNHGHYVESLYSLMSTLNTMVFPDRKRPTVVYDLEAENFAWIDFFWSTMGRSGGVGRDIGLVYDKLQDEKQVKKLIANLSAGLVEKYNPPKWIEGVETQGLTWLLDIILGTTAGLERNKPAQLLSSDAQQGLQSYMEGPLLEQIRVEHIARKRALAAA